MIATKVFNFTDKIYYVIVKFVLSSLAKQESQTLRLVDEVNQQTKDRIEFAKQIVFDAEQTQLRSITKLSFQQEKVKEQYQDILKRAGL